MPEGPEVALTAEILNAKLKNQILTKIKFVSGRYGPDRSKPVGYDFFKKYLSMTVLKVNSKGKFMWFELESESDNTKFYIFNTFGLTGMWSFSKPKYNRIKMTFEDGTSCYYSDMRNFGTFKFSNNGHELKSKLEELGPDVLKDDDFNLSMLKKYTKPIVEVICSQKVLSGIGNYLSAEILYEARISPHRPANSLTSNERSKLLHAIKYVTKLAYTNNDIGYMINLKTELADDKDITVKKNYHPSTDIDDNVFNFNVYGKKFDPKGNKVIADKIIKGRTTYWVKELQK